MKKILTSFHLTLILILTSFNFTFAQSYPLPSTAKLVKNTNPTGKWGNSPAATLEHIKTVGGIDEQDENFQFYLPEDLAVDSEGNIYVLDAGNHRILKFDENWKHVTTFGEKGQGPGELGGPRSIEIDKANNIYVLDPSNSRIQVYTPNGKPLRSQSPIDASGSRLRLHSGENFVISGGELVGNLRDIMTGADVADINTAYVFDKTHKNTLSFGIFRDLGAPAANISGNGFYYAVDNLGNTVMTYRNQNRIEKYNAEGNLVLRIERQLNYEEFIPVPKTTSTGGGGMFMSAPEKPAHLVSQDVGIDANGRIWVLTLARQFKENEEVEVVTTFTMGADGRPVAGDSQVKGNTRLRKTDIFEFEIFDRNGELLGRIPMPYFIDSIRIVKNRLFIIDKLRGVQIHEYRIKG